MFKCDRLFFLVLFFFDLCSICMSSTYGPRGLWWHMPPLVLQHTLWQVWGVFLRVLWRECQQVPHRARMSECLQQRYIVIIIITYLFMPAIPSGAYRPLTRFLQVLLSCALFFDNIIINELFHEQILRNNKAKADFELTLKCVTFFLNSRAFTRKIFCFITYGPR